MLDCRTQVGKEGSVVAGGNLNDVLVKLQTSPEVRSELKSSEPMSISAV